MLISPTAALYSSTRRVLYTRTLSQTGKACSVRCNVYSRHLFGRGNPPPPKKTCNSHPNGCQIVCSKFFSAGMLNYKSLTETLIHWTMNTGNYSSLSNQKGANLCIKCTKICLATELRPVPLGELVRFPKPSSRNGGPTSKERKGRGEGKTLLLLRVRRGSCWKSSGSVRVGKPVNDRSHKLH